MLIARGTVIEAAEDSISVIEATHGWVLSGRINDGPWSFEFDSTLVSNKPDMAFLVINRLGSPKLVWASEVYNDRVAHAHVMSRVNVSAIEPVAVFAVEASGDAHCFVSSSNVYVGNLDCVIDTSGRTQSEVIGALVPSLQSYLRKLLAKRALLGQLSTTDSLAALEAQLDLLTSVVSSLTLRLPEEERPALAALLTGITDQAGTATLHSEDKLLQEIEGHKLKVRVLQREYFAQRGEAV